jgi:hypothetical protein
MGPAADTGQTGPSNCCYRPVSARRAPGLVVRCLEAGVRLWVRVHAVGLWDWGG